MAKQDLPDPELLRKLLWYDPETGKLFWRERPREMFSEECRWKGWNTKFAGKEAFTSDDAHGYKVGRVLSKTYRAHRVAWALVHGKWPEDQIDHISGGRSDNRLENLRAVTNAENHKNEKRSKNNTSGVMGVYWHKRDKIWCACIGVAGKNRNLGRFKCIGAAAAARAVADIEYGFHPNHGR